ncbi:MAG: class I SAM-dependent methyltransferase [Clostridiales bacterium]|jgi:23S rRNA (cytosine1962-C5)-methyltransferase|nr:class I SAM-dependent methyltransferase [Eubacteriales bacterium]MDH7567180.1 class I SAM-dependent methyltransferase [Clostridiales bacterium]
MLVAEDWIDYELMDTGNGERLERWGKYVLIRPDPQVIWPRNENEDRWKKADAHYHRSRSGGGRWEYIERLPSHWTVSYNGLSFRIKPTDFKHTGLFPEQAANWKWIIEKIHSAGRPVKVLNLFAYTGGATVAAASAGAEVCHVDAAKGMVSWAKENIALSGLGDRPVRFITDDVIKFVQREKRRGKYYDGIIMDPPSYGRGPKGEVWKIEDALFGFVEECIGILSPRPLFFLVNSYTTGFSPTVLANILKMLVGKRCGGRVSCGEIGLPVKSSGLILPCGIYGRWETGK